MKDFGPESLIFFSVKSAAPASIEQEEEGSQVEVSGITVKLCQLPWREVKVKDKNGWVTLEAQVMETRS